MNTDYKKVVLKENKDIPVRAKNHLIFSGSLKFADKTIRDGDIVKVFSADNKFLGYAFFNSKSTILIRMINFDGTDPLIAIKKKIENAFNLRKELFDFKSTNAYRLINSEGDGLSGLTIDIYKDTAVFQIQSIGFEKLKNYLVSVVADVLKIKNIYEKSDLPSRRSEGLERFEGLLKGDVSKVEILENNVKFSVDIRNGHKTGFYLDQRSMRKFVGEISKTKRILNCFGYTGGFSVFAALGGSDEVTTVDISKEAISESINNFKINNIDPSKHKFVTADVFEYLENEKLDQDIIILDPPAFAKKASDVPNALKGYAKINRTTLKKMKPGSLLLTCSCSYHVDNESFKGVLYKAAKDANRNVRILIEHMMAPDHCINISNRELSYLKSYLLYVE